MAAKPSDSVWGMYNLPVNDVMMDGEEEIGAGVQVNFDQARMYDAWQKIQEGLFLLILPQSCFRGKWGDKMGTLKMGHVHWTKELCQERWVWTLWCLFNAMCLRLVSSTGWVQLCLRMILRLCWRNMVAGPWARQLPCWQRRRNCQLPSSKSIKWRKGNSGKSGFVCYAFTRDLWSSVLIRYYYYVNCGWPRKAQNLELSTCEDQLIMRLTGCTLDQLLAGRDVAWWHQWGDLNQGEMMWKSWLKKRKVMVNNGK